MAFDSFGQRCQQVLAASPELYDYQRWLTEQGRAKTGRDYLFADDRPRFEPRQDDVVVALPGLEVRSGKGKRVRLRCPRPAAELEFERVPRRAAQRVLAAIDGKRCLLEVRWQCGVDRDVMKRFLRATFGRVLFAPQAVAALEEQLSGMDIVRFPAPPYAIERPYWENMISLRKHFVAHEQALDDRDQFVQLLRELHVLALMGSQLDSFYQPASPGADKTVAPGALLLAEPRWKHTAGGTIFLDGPRAKVPLLGSAAYHQALYRALGDPSAADAERELTIDGLPWGRVITARAERDDDHAPWFCPPRPLADEHLEALRVFLHAAVVAAREGEPEAGVGALARFHHAFVRLHPFHCANQCLSMNLVNAVLSRTHGAGMPHFILDHLALRLAPEAYEEAFRRAVAALVVSDAEPADRLAELLERRHRLFALIERLGQCAAGAAVDEALRADPDAARWALLE